MARAMSPRTLVGGKKSSLFFAVSAAASACAGLVQLASVAGLQYPKKRLLRAELTDQSAARRWCKSEKSAPEYLRERPRETTRNQQPRRRRERKRAERGGARAREDDSEGR